MTAPTTVPGHRGRVALAAALTGTRTATARIAAVLLRIAAIASGPPR